ncbi:hypothetical protein RJ641_030271, partial [Dillenia turbinata]
SLPINMARVPVQFCQFISFAGGNSQSLLGCRGYRKKYAPVIFCQQSKISVLDARSIAEVYDALAERLVPTAAAASNPNLKYIIGLAGSPGAGKGTLASEVVKCVNKLWLQKPSSLDSEVKPSEVAIVIPMDGFHLYRHQLDAMDEAHARRGVADSAPWTFDPTRLLHCLQTLRSQVIVEAESRDPVEDDIFVSLQHKVVIVEGNYLLLEEGVWKEVQSIFNGKWFIEVDIDNAMERVRKRHISTGIPPDVAKWLIEYNDRPNGELVNRFKHNADLVIKSIDF